MITPAQKLSQIFSYLPEAEQKTLLDFAEFLQSRAPQVKTVPAEPLSIPRPETESVVAAIKRLTQTYPMIERHTMLNETSDLMMQHLLRGRAAMEIVDELEALFEKRFQEFVNRSL
ncbi:MAG: hypothetical protein QG652_701 [Pseudomonadota bacterium]|nr:hypothetical protein [Pseudomonadota bacterium]